MRTWRDYHPFKFFVVPGLLFLLAGFGLAVFLDLHVYFPDGITGRVGSLITSGVFLLFGFQLIMIGLLADMIQTHTKYS